MYQVTVWALPKLISSCGSSKSRHSWAGYPHDIKGQGIYAYVTLNAGEPTSDALLAELRSWVRKEIGPIATPDYCSGRQGFQRQDLGKSCAVFCVKLQPMSRVRDTSTLPTHRWLMI